MTQKEKELQLRDLCARIPYRSKGIITYDESNTIFTVEGIDNNVLHLSDAEECNVEDFKLYLHPMSSMTKEEKEIYYRTFDPTTEEPYYRAKASSFDWLNAHHFDYRGLIEKGLALEAPEGMYETK